MPHTPGAARPPLPAGPLGHPHSAVVRARLSRAHGQLGAIIKMVEAEAPCQEVLTQLAAVRGAVQRSATLLLRDHVKSCLADAYATGRGEDASEELMALLNTFVK